jgi:3-oxoacyl-[acyl-carrier-protein] synthase III
MKHMRNSKIAGLGYFVPETVVSNKELESLMDTNDEWITERTGIKERRWAKKGEDTSASMGYNAAVKALENAGMEASEIDFIVFATLSPDYFFPGCGVQIQEMLGVDTIGALDVRNQCSGFVYGMSVADQFIKTGMYNNILVIGSELQSSGLDKTTRGRGVSVIFGDGAGAVVMSPSDGDSAILSTHLHSEGKFAEELVVVNPSTQKWVDELIDEKDDSDLSYYPYMNGSFVFKNAVTRFPQVIGEALKANNMGLEDLNILIPHQANLRISQFVQRTLGLRDDQVYSNIQKYGNTTAASIPIALCEAVADGKIKKGDIVCLAAFGSGFTWASALIRW